jgi:type IV pilus assembly protein PilX
MTLQQNFSVQSKRNVIKNNAHLKSMRMLKQRGVVLFIALIALLVLSLAAVALIRSSDTNTLITGNLAFKQAATASADAGVEAAITWLQSQNNGSALDNSIASVGYTASTTNNAGDPIGTAYWDALSANVCLLPIAGGVCSAAGVEDASGNIVAFIIQRLCKATGGSTGAQCIASTSSSSTQGNNEGAGEDTLEFSTAVYYRIIVRVTGPRNTVSYVQSIVSM